MCPERAFDPSSMPTDTTSGHLIDPSTDLKGRRIVYLATLLAGEDLSNNLLSTSFKPLATNTYAYTWDDSAALEASSVTKASAGNLYYAVVTNTNAAVRYFQVFRRKTIYEPYTLIKEYDFNENPHVVRNERPSKKIIEKLLNPLDPKTYFILTSAGEKKAAVVSKSLRQGKLL